MEEKVVLILKLLMAQVKSLPTNNLKEYLAINIAEQRQSGQRLYWSKNKKTIKTYAPFQIKIDKKYISRNIGEKNHIQLSTTGGIGKSII